MEQLQKKKELVYTVKDLCRGYIHVESVPEEGSKFSVNLPLS
jgi:signal transduction histidine kinase